MTLILGDCLEQMKSLETNSVDAIVTDPPYGLSFMGKKWDYDVPSVSVWREVLRVLKPGAHLLSFGGTRTYHRLACNIEDAGFEIRDQIQWIYGSGFPKSHNGPWGGTALKPANEPIVLARKPLIGTVAKNVEKFGTGGLNIDESRIDAKPRKTGTRLDGAEIEASPTSFAGSNKRALQVAYDQKNLGRWPANVILDEEAARLLDEQSGFLHGAGNKRPMKQTSTKSMFLSDNHSDGTNPNYHENHGGGASRFFYCAKASKRERNAGLDKHGVFKLETSLCKDGNTALVALLQRVISESTAKWLIDESGKNVSVQFPMDTKSIIETKIRQTIESKILSCLIHSLTSDSIQDASLSTENGSNHAANAAQLKLFLLNTTSAKTELALGVAHAALQTLQKINESVAQPASNFHSTVKPIKLMQYLIKLVTPPGGTVLDPFMGSGSTGVAAKSLGFKFIGIEMNEEYLEIAKRRIEHSRSVA